jgi:hypothetical protein
MKEQTSTHRSNHQPKEILMKNAIPSIENSFHCSPWQRGFLFIPLAFAAAYLAFSPQAGAACQEGCDITNFNTFLGDDALITNTTGASNTAIGVETLENNTKGSENTAIGDSALTANTTGNDNTATGGVALVSNTSGSENTGTGVGALANNGTGNHNTATGFSALYFNTADNNTASGYDALLNNSTGANNVANGVNALLSNISGSFNAVNGVGALKASMSGSNNAAEGYRALYTNTTGGSNTALGSDALMNNTSGSSNIAVGVSAGSKLTTGDNNIDIGALGVVGEANTMRLGKAGTQTTTFIAGISGVTVGGGVGVIIDSTGHLGTVVSSERFKNAIKPMDKASEAILALKPVTFHYKHELDPKGIPQFGLVAEQVEKVNPDLVARDEQGKPYTVRYEAVNAMLLNEFLKEHRKVEEQQKEIEALASQLQKVRNEIELIKPAPRVVVNQ